MAFDTWLGFVILMLTPLLSVTSDTMSVVTGQHIGSLPIGTLLIGFLGLATQGDSGNELERLTEKVERLTAGEHEVDFATDRDDVIGRLSSAIGELAATLREQKRGRCLKERAIEAAPLGVTITDPSLEDNPIVYTNEGFEQVTGYSPEAAAGNNCRFLQGEKTREERVAQLREAVNGEESTSVELRNYREDGTEFWNRVNVAPIKDDDGTITHFVGFQDDATERKARERELKRNERQLDTVFDDPTMLFGLLEPDGTLRRVNQADFEYVDVDPDAVVGDPFPATPWWKDTPEEDVQKWIDRAATGEYVQYEVDLDGPDGDRHWMSGAFRSVMNEAGEVVSVVVSARDITDQKKREQNLHELTKQSSAIIEASPTAFVATDLDGNVDLWNPAAEDIFGWDEDEMLGDPPPFVPEDRSDEFEKFRKRLLDGESLADIETRRFTKDGDLIDVSLSAAPIYDDNGTVIGIIQEFTDISERKDRERQLETTNTRLEARFEHSPDMVGVLDTDGTIETINRRVCDELGYTKDELVGTGIWEYDQLYDESDVRALLDDISVDERRKFEGRFQRRDGSIFPIEIHLIHLDLEDAPCFMAISRDISERKEREQELQRYKEHTNNVLDAIDDVFYVLDEDGHLQRWNESLSEATGYTDEEIAKMHAQDFFDEHARDRIAEAIVDVFETGDTRLEAELRTKDGEHIPHEFVATALKDLDGNPVLAGIGRDISERKETERQLSRLISNVPGFVYRCRNAPEWPVEFASEGVRDITGYDPAALETGEVTWGEDIMVERTGEIWEYVQKRLDDQEPFDLTYPIETAAGERRWVKEQGRGVYAEDGAVKAIESVLIDITDRITYERELQRTQRLLEQSQKLAQVGAWEIDVSGDERLEVTMTDEVYRIHDLSVDADFDLEDGSEFYHPEDWQRLRDAIDDAIERGEAYDMELRVTTAKGNERWARTIGNPIFQRGEVVAIRGAFQDITERKQREKELKRTKNLLDRTEDLANVGGWEIDIQEGPPYDGTQTDGLYRLHDLSTDEVFPIERGLEFVHPEDREDVDRAVTDLLVDGEPFDIERRIVTANGDLRWVRGVGVPVVKDDETVKYRGALVDITDRKRREEELERTKNLLQQAQRMTGVAGWELDVSTGPPYTPELSDQIYELTDVSKGEALAMDELFEFIHPDDREQRWSTFEQALEAGEGWDHETRLATAEGNERWVHSIGEPIFEDGEVTRLRGSIQDITEHKERELALESLHEATRGLLGTETEEEIAEVVVETAEDVLNVPGVSVYLLDTESNQLEPTAFSPKFVELCEGAPAAAPRDSAPWNAFVTGSGTVFDNSELFSEDIADGIAVPIADHGVFIVATSSTTIDDEIRRLVETLVATTVAAFDRLESELNLRKRDSELEDQNRRLRRQRQINNIIRRIDQSLIGRDSREKIETDVCERLVEAEDIAFAWIGTYDVSGTELMSRAWAGTGEKYLDAVTLDEHDTGMEPAVSTAREEAPTVVTNVINELKTEPWRKRALAHSFHSVVSVPLSFDEYFYGVLTVYADEPNVFGDLEQTVFAELGENIANSINAIETRQALYADNFIELTLQFDSPDAFLAKVAQGMGAHVEYEGLATITDGETRLFFTADVDPAIAAEVLDDLLIVTNHWLVGESNGRPLFGVAVEGEVIASRLVRHGGRLRSITATEAGLEVVVDVPMTIDVREFVEMLRERYPSVELVGRHDVHRGPRAERQQVESLIESLTDRQLEVLRTAYFSGFFEWPRESTGEDIAKMLSVSQPTVNRHLRLGQQRLFEQLFENTGTTGS
ncbi:PAS domain S-box protein [Halosolutus halophilus]|uniref:PAS domain S-box protein n=1 Tax=Halosolutus halophilus TaxID=1552990 RepID=UPI00223521C5|nr:PAS domain S-box protein [Halosolutus halophilus]